jgi:hypothetical protein
MTIFGIALLESLLIATVMPIVFGLTILVGPMGQRVRALAEFHRITGALGAGFARIMQAEGLEPRTARTLSPGADRRPGEDDGPPNTSSRHHEGGADAHP